MIANGTWIEPIGILGDCANLEHLKLQLLYEMNSHTISPNAPSKTREDYVCLDAKGHKEVALALRALRSEFCTRELRTHMRHADTTYD